MADERDMERRAYITGWQDKKSVGERTPVEVTFSFRAEDAHFWPSKQAAQRLCPEFDAYEITVDWAEGGLYVCKDFRVEKRTEPPGFVIFCDGPFTFKATGSKVA
jgi:hypothetical protein